MGLWGDESAPEPFEAQRARFELLVGERAGASDRLDQELTWEPAGAGGLPGGEAVDVLEGPAPGQLPAGGLLSLRLVVADGAVARAWLEGTSASAEAPRVLSDGPLVLRWRLRAVVPPGDYRLCCAAWDPANERPVGPVRSFEVHVGPGGEAAPGVWLDHGGR